MESVGVDFLRHFAVEIDFDKGRLRIWSSRPASWPSESTLALSSHHGCPAVNITLPDGRRESFVLDTGANSSSIKADIFDMCVANGDVLPAGSRRGVTATGVVEEKSGYLRYLRLGVFAHEHVRIDRDFQSALGLSYLSRYVVGFDFPDRQLHLTKGGRFAVSAPAATSGMSIVEIRGHKTVVAIGDRGPAKLAGVQLYDVIQSVDGQPASQLDLFGLRELLTSKPGRVVELQMIRPNETAHIRLTLADQRPDGRHRVADLRDSPETR